MPTATKHRPASSVQTDPRVVEQQQKLDALRTQLADAQALREMILKAPKTDPVEAVCAGMNPDVAIDQHTKTGDLQRAQQRISVLEQAVVQQEATLRGVSHAAATALVTEAEFEIQKHRLAVAQRIHGLLNALSDYDVFANGMADRGAPLPPLGCVAGHSDFAGLFRLPPPSRAADVLAQWQAKLQLHFPRVAEALEL